MLKSTSNKDEKAITIHSTLNGENSFNNNVYFHSTDVFKIDKIETRKKDKLEHTNDDENDIVKAEKDLNKEAKLEQLTSSEHGEVLKGTESSMARHTVGGPMTGPSRGCTGAGSGPENRTVAVPLLETSGRLKLKIMNSGFGPTTRKIDSWVKTQKHQIVNSGFGLTLY